MRASRVLPFLGFIALVACSQDPHPTPERIDVPEEAVFASFGRFSDSTGVQEFSRVTGARIAASGRYLAVVDAAPPFVRVFDLVNDSAWAFGRYGGGPGELGGAPTADFLGDSALVVMSGMPGTRYDRFTVQGQWEFGVRTPVHGILGSSLATACGGRIFVYGIPGGSRSAHAAPWIHEVTPDFETAIETRLTISGRAVMRYGALFGVDGTDEGVWVWHRQIQSGVEAGYWIPCEASPPVLIDQKGAEGSVEDAFLHGGQAVLRTVLPDTLFAGAAAQSGTLVRAFRWKDGDTWVTALRAVSDHDCDMVELIGRWTLRALHRNRVVLSREDPHPTVQVVDWNYIVAHLTDVPCLAG
jgi:hypothetical protein